MIFMEHYNLVELQIQFLTSNNIGSWVWSFDAWHANIYCSRFPMDPGFVMNQGAVWFPKCNIKDNGNGLHSITSGNKFE
jgi:hypothetical protein